MDVRGDSGGGGEREKRRECALLWRGKARSFLVAQKTWSQTQIKRLLRVSRLSIVVAVNLRERSWSKEREEEKDSRRSLLEEGRHVARLCFRLFSGCIVRKRARARVHVSVVPPHFSSSGDVSARTFHFVATRIIFFLSREIKKHLLGRGSLIYHLVQPVTESTSADEGDNF